MVTDSEAGWPWFDSEQGHDVVTGFGFCTTSYRTNAEVSFPRHEAIYTSV